MPEFAQRRLDWLGRNRAISSTALRVRFKQQERFARSEGASAIEFMQFIVPHR